MTKEEALVEIRRYGREIISVELADQIAQAFGIASASALNVVRERSVGASWETRETVTKDGPSVGMYQLALAICAFYEIDIPPSPYMGVGKSADYYSFTAARALHERFVAGVEA